LAELQPRSSQQNPRPLAVLGLEGEGDEEAEGDREAEGGAEAEDGAEAEAEERKGDMEVWEGGAGRPGTLIWH
jgi:hypothetical protein